MVPFFFFLSTNLIFTQLSKNEGGRKCGAKHSQFLFLTPRDCAKDWQFYGISMELILNEIMQLEFSKYILKISILHYLKKFFPQYC